MVVTATPPASPVPPDVLSSHTDAAPRRCTHCFQAQCFTASCLRGCDQALIVLSLPAKRSGLGVGSLRLSLTVILACVHDAWCLTPARPARLLPGLEC